MVLLRLALVAFALTVWQPMSAKADVSLRILNMAADRAGFELSLGLSTLVRLAPFPEQRIDLEMVATSTKGFPADLFLADQNAFSLPEPFNSQPDAAASIMVIKSEQDGQLAAYEILTRSNLDDAVVYELTKTIFENSPQLARLGEQKWLVSADHALGALHRPLHPGAGRYYGEIGVTALPPTTNAQHIAAVQALPIAKESPIAKAAESVFYVYFNQGTAELNSSSRETIDNICAYAKSMSLNDIKVIVPTIEPATAGGGPDPVKERRPLAVLDALESVVGCPQPARLADAASRPALPPGLDLAGVDSIEIVVTGQN